MPRIPEMIDTAPAHWAAYLVNNDASGLEADEKVHADAWLAARKGWHVVSVPDEAQSRFTWHYKVYNPLAKCSGGEVLDYILLATT